MPVMRQDRTLTMAFETARTVPELPVHPSKMEITEPPQALLDEAVVVVSRLGAHTRTTVSLYPNTTPP
jgi:hypothetical protein